MAIRLLSTLRSTLKKQASIPYFHNKSNAVCDLRSNTDSSQKLDIPLHYLYN